MTSLDLQVYSFFVMALAGIALGLCFDTYRILRFFWRPDWLGTAAGDLLFGLVAGLLLATALLLASWGELRLYVFLGVLAGFGLYQELAGETYRRWLGATLRLTGRAVGAGLRTMARFLALVAAGLMLLLQPFFWLADATARLAAVAGLPMLRTLRPLKAWGKRALDRPAAVWRWFRRKRD